MKMFTTYNLDNAPAASRPTLESINKSWGFIPNLSANMAESPELLAGYTGLWDLFSKSSLTPAEQQVVFLTVSYENECGYCMAGHSLLAKMQKIDDAIVQAIRDG